MAVLGRVCRIAVAGTLLLAGTGCTGPAAGARPRLTAHPAATPSRQPAEAAGGACLLLSFEQVAAAIGMGFGVSAASNSGDTYTCVLRGVDTALPDLALSVSPTLADPGVFSRAVVPKGSTNVADLGKAGYRRSLPAAGGAGPAVEVGWLSGNQRLLVLRYRTPPGTAPAAADAVLPRLVALAK